MALSIFHRQSVVDADFNSIGNSSSNISLSIMHKPSTATVTQGTCIGCVDIAFGTLLTRCADNDCTCDTYMNAWSQLKVEQLLLWK
jgi:hypothetical protein